MRHPFLMQMTDTQLERLYAKAHDKLRRNTGTASWDWPTLKICYSGWHNTLRMILHNFHAR